jgi:hypothetical protein
LLELKIENDSMQHETELESPTKFVERMRYGVPSTPAVLYLENSKLQSSEEESKSPIKRTDV